jgi:hypothetical protein
MKKYISFTALDPQEPSTLSNKQVWPAYTVNSDAKQDGLISEGEN